LFRFFRNRFNSKKVKINEEKLLKEYGNCRMIKSHIKLLIISDTHGLLSYKEEYIGKLKEIKDYDLCCCLGDISYSDFEEILKYVPKEKIVAILGNHDDFDVLNHFNLNDLNGKTITINGIRIGGMQGSYKYKDEKFPSFTHEESIEFLNALGEVDILLSHTGPYLGLETNEVHSGLIGITEYLYKNHVPYNIHGHNHQNEDRFMKNGTRIMERYLIEKIEL